MGRGGGRGGYLKCTKPLVYRPHRPFDSSPVPPTQESHGAARSVGCRHGRGIGGGAERGRLTGERGEISRVPLTWVSGRGILKGFLDF